ncbi:hypothetical protein ACO0LD_15270 [Undibacterium sp. Ji83W]|uniref:hypothetical protein n=1 Tax=Undibacterium sp. Ji83W TaxID=3413043 RepID=UPI003BF2275D
MKTLSNLNSSEHAPVYTELYPHLLFQYVSIRNNASIKVMPQTKQAAMGLVPMAAYILIAAQ